MVTTTQSAVVSAEVRIVNPGENHIAFDSNKEKLYRDDQDDRKRQEGAPMPNESNGPKPLLEIESLADGESSVLGAFARIEPDILDQNRDEPYWVERISQLKEGLKTPFAKQIASYILREEDCDDSASPAKQAAWRLAHKMMMQVQPGYEQKIRAAETRMVVAKN